ncbi:MAG: ABC transporter ATP-binding protein [Thermoanaerobaculia bacterium]
MPDPSPWAVSVSELSKSYRIYPRRRDRLLEVILGRARHEEVHALRGISIRVRRGAVTGLIGENGSGKSTFLKILAGTTTPTAGEVGIEGRVAAVLELGAAFHPEVTGRRNAILQAALSGLSGEELATVLPEIEAFADLGDFFDRPVKTYSSGMAMRLAFAVATAVLPDIVILDEALAVGDARFQKKCIDRIWDLKASGRTILFCTHALYYVSTFCDEAIWLDGGKVAGSGPAHEVVLAYERFLSARSSRASTGETAAEAVAQGSHARIVSVHTVDAEGARCGSFRPREPWGVELEIAVDEASRPVHVHVGVNTPDNVTCFSLDSRLDGFGPISGRTRHRVRVALDVLPLSKGEFVVFAFLGDEKALVVFDARSDARFRVESEIWTSGLVPVEARWQALP